jgi:hypothetical protein
MTDVKHRTIEANISRVATVRPADMEQLISVMVLAFAADPVARWMYRDPQRYLSYFGRFIRAFTGKAFSAGTAWCICGNLGGALWLPPGVKPDGDAIAAILSQLHERLQPRARPSRDMRLHGCDGGRGDRMCLHNARRHDFLLRPLAIRQRASAIFWNPITGGLQNDPHAVQAPFLPPKLRKGRNVLDTTAPDNGKALTLGPAHRLLSARDAAAGRS